MNPQPKTKRIRLKKHAYSKLKAYVHERDNRTCLNPECECKKDPTKPTPCYILTIHHVHKRGRGGSDTKENTGTVCMFCHELIEAHKISDDFIVKYLNKLYTCNISEPC